MANIRQPMKLTVVTIRYGVTEPQIQDFVKQYCSDDRGKRRFDEIAFWKNGYSRTITVDLGMQIETVIQIQPMTDSDKAMLG